MMRWEDIDNRLAAIARNRAWLAEVTPYSVESIRNALAPSSTRRSGKMLIMLSRAIEDEEALRQAESPMEVREVGFGVWSIFRSSEELHRADKASRIVGAESITEYCHDVVLRETDRILAESADRYRIIPLDPELRVADDDASSA
jgi:hypothetical protein